MANHKSSEKRARGSLRKRERNRTYLSAVRTAVKTFKAAVATGAAKEGESLNELLQSAQSMLAKAAAKGMLHRNNAARRIARLAHMMKTPATAVAKPVKAAKKTAKPVAKTVTKSRTSSTPAKKVAKKKK